MSTRCVKRGEIVVWEDAMESADGTPYISSVYTPVITCEPGRATPRLCQLRVADRQKNAQSGLVDLRIIDRMIRRSARPHLYVCIIEIVSRRECATPAVYCQSIRSNWIEGSWVPVTYTAG